MGSIWATAGSCAIHIYDKAPDIFLVDEDYASSETYFAYILIF